MGGVRPFLRVVCARLAICRTGIHHKARVRAKAEGTPLGQGDNSLPRSVRVPAYAKQAGLAFRKPAQRPVCLGWSNACELGELYNGYPTGMPRMVEKKREQEVERHGKPSAGRTPNQCETLPDKYWQLCSVANIARSRARGTGCARARLAVRAAQRCRAAARKINREALPRPAACTHRSVARLCCRMSTVQQRGTDAAATLSLASRRPETHRARWCRSGVKSGPRRRAAGIARRVPGSAGRRRSCGRAGARIPPKM